MVLRVIIKRGQGRLYDSSEESSSSSFEESFVAPDCNNHGTRRVIIPAPPRLAKSRTRPLADLEYFVDRLDSRLHYSICKEQFDHIKWPSEQQAKRRLILQGLEERRDRPAVPKKKSSSAPQNIHQRRVPAEVLPVYNSENTAKWPNQPSTLYPDVHTERTWISYKGQKPRRTGVHYNSNHKLRNYF
ncbi:unnamed protein product [Calypogeia fissa]